MRQHAQHSKQAPGLSSLSEAMAMQFARRDERRQAHQEARQRTRQQAQAEAAKALALGLMRAHDAWVAAGCPESDEEGAR